MLIRNKHISAAGSAKLASVQSGAILWSVNVNTKAAGATLTIYDAESADSSKIVAVIDCSQVGSWWYGSLCNGGIYWVLAGGSPDITLGYS